MTKADIVNEISKNTGIEKVTVQKTVEAFMESIKDSTWQLLACQVTPNITLFLIFDCVTQYRLEISKLIPLPVANPSIQRLIELYYYW